MDFRELITTRTPNISVRCIRFALWPLSFVYGAGAAIKNLLYDWKLKSSFKSPLTVISVGNLSVGGTGKSPVVSWLASWIRERGARVAILSRGYGQLADGQNDEALELEIQHRDVPHIQHWDRVNSAKLAEEELEMQCLLLDDAFQHRRIARDLDIVLIDSTDQPSCRRLLPAGLLREPLASLSRADVVMLTRADQANPPEREQLKRQIAKRAPQALIIECEHHPRHTLAFPDERQPLATLRGKNVLAFCGIGNPDSFFQCLESLGATLIGQRTWPDHHAYDAGDMKSLALWTEEHPTADLLICTVKDWVKLRTRQIGNAKLVALAIELNILSGQTEFEALLAEKLTSTLDR